MSNPFKKPWLMSLVTPLDLASRNSCNLLTISKNFTIMICHELARNDLLLKTGLAQSRACGSSLRNAKRAPRGSRDAVSERVIAALPDQ